MFKALVPSRRGQLTFLSLLGLSSVAFSSEAAAQSCGCNTFSSPVTVTSSSTTSTGLSVTTSGGTGAVYGTNNGLLTYQHAVIGRAYGYNGIGVYGIGSGISGYGGYAVATGSNGTGLYAEASSTTGSTYGLYATAASTSGSAVFARETATTGQNYGIYAESLSTSGTGVLGTNGAPSGTTYGVSGQSASPSGFGVFGVNSATSGTAFGVYGKTYSTAGIGVTGVSFATSGGGTGVLGSASSESGVGVLGWAHASTGATQGVRGLVSSPNGYGVFSYGNTGATGTKSAIVPTSEGPTELYAEESTEIWFSDHGTGRLEDGIARVDLDPDFLEVVTVDNKHPLMVFVQLEGEANGVYVEKDEDGFFVVELQDGTSDAAFSYRVVAKRTGYEDRRLRRVDVDLDVSGVAPRKPPVPAAAQLTPPKPVPLPE